MIDLYCERITSGMFDEPLNLLSNLAFFVCGILLYQQYKTKKPFYILRNRVLVLLIPMIGFGSMSWHAFPLNWTQLFDVIPILGFIFLYIYCFSIDLLNLSKQKTALILFAFTLIQFATIFFLSRDMLNGSIFYLPSVLFLFSFTVVVWHQKLAFRVNLVKCNIIYICAIFFRSIDMNYCDNWNYGTHFIWHLLCSILFYIMIKMLFLSHDKYSIRPSISS